MTHTSSKPSVRPPRRIAIVHEWLESFAGSERVLAEILRCYPAGDLHAVCDFLAADQRAFLNQRPVRTSFIQRLPWARAKFRHYLPLMPVAIEQFDMSSYDVVVSSSHAVAKGVITGPDQLHISYIHTPIRYAWELQHNYLPPGGLKSMLIRVLLHKLRLWDYATARRADVLVANSKYVARRIAKCYGRRSRVIYPPVDIDSFPLREDKEDYYVTAARLVRYKRVDLIVEAFSALRDRKLIVIGDGPEMAQIKKLAGPNVTLLGYQSDAVLREHLQRARAFIFSAEEDFGIAPLEAQACGTPVIAFGKGGALETVVDGETGEFFGEQTTASLVAAVRRFEQRQDRYDPYRIRANAERFSPERFRLEFMELVGREWNRFTRRGSGARWADEDEDAAPQWRPSPVGAAPKAPTRAR